MTQLVQVEAYLGPDKPDTIAEAVVAIPDGKDHRDYHYAVVAQHRETGECSLVGLTESEGVALEELEQATSSRRFGILCNVRTELVQNMEAEALSVS